LSASTDIRENVDALLNKYYDGRKKHDENAKHFLDLALEADPNDVRVLKEMGALLLEQKKPEEALEYFVCASDLDPTDTHTIRQIGYILEAIFPNQPQPKQEIPVQNSNVDALLNKYYEARKSHDENAKHFLDLAIEVAPDDIRVRKEMGIFLLQQKKPKEALEHFVHVTELDPTDLQAIKQIGYILASFAPRREAVKQDKTVDSLLNKYYEVRKKQK